MTTITHYELVDIKTQKVIGIYQERRRASRRVDKLDLIYGAIRYIVRPVYA